MSTACSILSLFPWCDNGRQGQADDGRRLHCFSYHDCGYPGEAAATCSGSGSCSSNDCCSHSCCGHYQKPVGVGVRLSHAVCSYGSLYPRLLASAVTATFTPSAWCGATLHGRHAQSTPRRRPQAAPPWPTCLALGQLTVGQCANVPTGGLLCSARPVQSSWQPRDSSTNGASRLVVSDRGGHIDTLSCKA